MPSKRKFYRTVIEVEILSEDPYDADSRELSDIHDDITTGDCSGSVRVVKQEVLDGPAATRALQAQNSDPEFFMLTDEGEDVA